MDPLQWMGAVRMRVKLYDGCHTVRVQGYKYVDYIGVDHLSFNENSVYIGIVYFWLQTIVFWQVRDFF